MAELKRQRSAQDLIKTLKKHLDLLRDYSFHAFKDGDEKYYGELAGKLRLLVYNSGSNKPLLSALMKKHHIEIELEFDLPLGKKKMNLNQYLQSLAAVTKIESGELVQISQMKFIALWAHKMGAAHEDWTIPENLEKLVNSSIFIGGLQAGAAVLQVTTNVILGFGYEFLKNLEDLTERKGATD